MGDVSAVKESAFIKEKDIEAQKERAKQYKDRIDNYLSKSETGKN